MDSLPTPEQLMRWFVWISVVQAFCFIFLSAHVASMAMTRLGIQTESALEISQFKGDFSEPFVFLVVLGAKELALMVLYTGITAAKDYGLIAVTAVCRVSTTGILLYACKQFGIGNGFAVAGTFLDLSFGCATLFSLWQHHYAARADPPQQAAFASGLRALLARLIIFTAGSLEFLGGLCAVFQPEAVAVFAHLRGDLGPLLPFPTTTLWGQQGAQLSARALAMVPMYAGLYLLVAGFRGGNARCLKSCGYYLVASFGLVELLRVADVRSSCCTQYVNEEPQKWLLYAGALALVLTGEMNVAGSIETKLKKPLPGGVDAAALRRDKAKKQVQAKKKKKQ